MFESTSSFSERDPHHGQPFVTAGRAVGKARAAMILLHGRGSSAHSILQLASALDRSDFHFVAPEAAGNTWYPHSFLAPLETNEPFLGSALRQVGSAMETVTAAGIPADRIILLGFSQGACLALEFAACNARRLGGLVALAGGLIGPDGTPRSYPGNLDGTPVFLGTSDPDPHVPVARVEESGRILERMGATVEIRIYPGMPHTINEDEIARVRALMHEVAG
jgi:predicted esterase